MNSQFIKDRDEWILKHCKNKKVLHLGCTDWPLTEARIKTGLLLHAQLAKQTTLLVGVDPDSEGIAALSRLMPDYAFISCKAEDMQNHPLLTDEKWDIILAADVVEHISNLGQALDAMAGLMHPGTELIITTPSAFSIKRMLGLIALGREHVHPDHCYYFSESTLRQLLRRSGMIITEFSMFMWKNPTLKNKLLYALCLPLNLLTRGRMADEVALIAKKG